MTVDVWSFMLFYTVMILVALSIQKLYERVGKFTIHGIAFSVIAGTAVTTVYYSVVGVQSIQLFARYSANCV